MSARTLRPILFGGALFAAIWFSLVVPRFGLRSGEVFVVLAFGWHRFLGRFSEASVNWSGIGMVAVCSAVICLLIHGLTKSRRVTASVFSGVWLMFILSIAASGMFLRTRELIAWDQPMLDRRANPFVAMRAAQLTIRMALTDDADAAEVRRAVVG